MLICFITFFLACKVTLTVKQYTGDNRLRVPLFGISVLFSPWVTYSIELYPYTIIYGSAWYREQVGMYTDRIGSDRIGLWSDRIKTIGYPRIRRSDPKFRIVDWIIHIADMLLTDKSEVKLIIIYLTINQEKTWNFCYFMLICGLLCQKMCIAQFGNVGIKTLYVG